MTERRTLLEQMVIDADMQIDPNEDDEAAADEYPIPTEEMRAAGRALALKIVLLLETKSGETMMPRFMVAGDGGIGLHWRTDRIELLTTLSPRSNIARFYGETVDGSTLKGDIKPDSPLGFLAQWFVENAFPGRREKTR